jgi:hypothetical protein
MLFALSILLRACDATPLKSGGQGGVSSYDLSAIGHAGLYDVLRRTGRPVKRSVGNTLALVGRSGVLVVAEPELWRMGEVEGEWLMAAPRLLLVLPKWRGEVDEERPDWVSAVTPLPLREAGRTLELVISRSEVFRSAWPEKWDKNGIGRALPTGPEARGEQAENRIQLIRSRALKPVVSAGDGILLGELVYYGKKIWVLSDPDVMSNHGLGRGNNAAFMLALIDALRGWNNSDPGAAIVFDETVHGYRQAEGSPLTLLFRFPFALVSALVVLTGILLVWAGAGRFGAPRLPEAPLDFGKGKLIDNSARLLDYAGHHTALLARYAQMTVRLAAQALHAPPGLDEAALAAWLDRIGRARGVGASCADILEKVAGLAAGNTQKSLEPFAVKRQTQAQNAARTREAGRLAGLFGCARAVHKWKEEILHGYPEHKRHSQRHSQ